MALYMYQQALDRRIMADGTLTRDFNEGFLDEI